MKLGEALKNLTGLTTACMIQHVGNDQVFTFYIDDYKKSQGYETLLGGSPAHVESAHILIGILENIPDSEITQGSEEFNPGLAKTRVILILRGPLGNNGQFGLIRVLMGNDGQYWTAAYILHFIQFLIQTP